MNTDEVDAARACRAAIAVVAACSSGLTLTVAEAVGDAELPWVVVALGHLAAALLGRMPPEQAEAWLQSKALRIAADLAALTQREADQARETPDAPR